MFSKVGFIFIGFAILLGSILFTGVYASPSPQELVEATAHAINVEGMLSQINAMDQQCGKALTEKDFSIFDACKNLISKLDEHLKIIFSETLDDRKKIYSNMMPGLGDALVG